MFRRGNMPSTKGKYDTLLDTLHRWQTRKNTNFITWDISLVKQKKTRKNDMRPTKRRGYRSCRRRIGGIQEKENIECGDR